MRGYGGKITISFLGSLSRHHSLKTLVDSFGLLDKETASHYRFRIIGTYHKSHNKDFERLKNYGVSVEKCDWVDSETLEAIIEKDNDILFLAYHDFAYEKSMMPSKIWTYLELSQAHAQTIVAVVSEGSDIHNMLKDVSTVCVVEPTKPALLAHFLWETYRWQKDWWIATGNPMAWEI